MDGEIVRRREWGALDPFNEQYTQPPLENMVYYYSNTRSPQCYTFDECKDAIANLQKMHLHVLKMPDIAYNFVIAGDGRIYEGRGFNVLPPRFKFLHHMNRKAYLIGIMGDLKDRPSGKLWEATWRIVEIAYRNNYVTKDVCLTAEDKFEANFSVRGLEESKQADSLYDEPHPNPEIYSLTENLAANIKPSIDLSQFWKDPPATPKPKLVLSQRL